MSPTEGRDQPTDPQLPASAIAQAEAAVSNQTMSDSSPRNGRPIVQDNPPPRGLRSDG